ncbi:aminotransferase class V-fold PLP-dependent enzyme [Luteimonas sp. MC1572]|uniref:aminotransferase class V-fold PLP-dependent enzyme n=1 Tax=Luteimonas sp. MC1572 TaxID=2799325 RepID=UPI0018F08DCC|nr:aminotransferase class V-fold PLP-dependent enzyme [Luteimonas sp. MC1572]MBJ6980855.1 aminotransferase class V-fold PLP-dependent enzyme [Luteimonas sp. MC1572]QQO02215.1 aminotransferase class V-fold PLP-dependent enzyme [Luteimonas sp. MC1572]
MQVTRREFLAANAALAAAVLPGALLAALQAETPAAPDLSTWERVRAQFSLDPALMHLASFFIASHPVPVRDAIEGYRRAIDRNPFHVVEHGLFAEAEHNVQMKVQAEVADYLGARPQDVCLTGNTTTGLALVYHGLPLKAGDEVLCTTHDHYSHHESIRLANQRSGATMRMVPLYSDAATASTDAMVDALLKGIGPKTRVVGLTWVHSSTGMRLPIRELAAALRARSGPPLLLVVDGVHGLGSTDETVAGLGCDYFCAGTHKWMFAPRGTGLVWANADNWARLRPVIPSFSDLDQYQAWERQAPVASPTNADRMAPGGFHAFEHQWATAAAFAMHRQMGRARVAGRIRELNDQCKAGLAANPKVKLHTPISPGLSAGLVAFEVAGVSPADVVRQLFARNIVASTSPYAVTYARLAPSLVNTADEVERAVRAVREISGRA